MRRFPTVYLDYNASTPLDPVVRDVVIAGFESWGNPSSVHHVGQEARALLDDARDRVASVFRCRPSEIVFTGGGTEANNLAILGAARARVSKGRHLICSPTEHPAVLQCFEHLARHEGFEVSWLPVDAVGRVDPEAVCAAIRPDTTLVSVMAANNETGVHQPFAAIGRICREREVLYHCDAVQWFGKEPVPGMACFEADLVSFCAHKLHGPKGVGLVYLRAPLVLSRHMLGGPQENDRRAGTENLPLVLGLASAIERFLSPGVFPTRDLQALAHSLTTAVASVEGVQVVGPSTGRLSNTVGFVLGGSDSLALLANLDLEGICASSGSACSAGALEPSHVLLAQGYPPSLAAAFVRFSLGRETSAEQIRSVCDRLPAILARSRGC